MSINDQTNPIVISNVPAICMVCKTSGKNNPNCPRFYECWAKAQ